MPQFKNWNVTAEQIKDLRSLTTDVKFVNPKLKEQYDGHMYNSIVLLYDFEYDANKINYQNENNILDFIGCVDYSK